MGLGSHWGLKEGENVKVAAGIPFFRLQKEDDATLGYPSLSLYCMHVGMGSPDRQKHLSFSLVRALTDPRGAAGHNYSS